MPYQSIDLAMLDARLIARLDQGRLYDFVDRRDAINAAIMALAALGGVWKAREIIPIMPQMGCYLPLPSSIMSAIRVSCNGKPLAQSTILELDALVAGWEAQTVADGGAVPNRPLMWAPVGLYLIAIWPAVVVRGSFALEVDGFLRPPVLVNNGDYLAIESGQVSTLLDCAVHLLAFDQGGTVLAGSVAGLRGFLAATADLNGKIKGTGIYREVMGYDRARADRPLVQATIPPPPPPDGSGGAG